MRAFVQIPASDLRVLQSGDTGRLRTPHWPVARIGTLPRNESEFLRYFGALRPGLEPSGLIMGERPQCAPMRSAARFEPDFASHITESLRSKDLLDRRRFGSGIHLTCRGRTVAAAVDSPSAAFELAFEMPTPRRRLNHKHVSAILDALGTIPVVVHPNLHRPLARAGDSLADRYFQATTTTRGDHARSRSLLHVGTPLVLLQVDEDEIDQAPPDFRSVPTDLARRTFVRLSSEGRTGVDEWILVHRRDDGGANRAASHLRRFHSERFGLQDLWLAHQRHALGPSSPGGPFDLEATAASLRNTVSFLSRSYAYGHAQEELRQAFTVEQAVAGGTWLAAEDLSRTLGTAMIRRAQLVLVGEAHVGDIVYGDKFDGDKFQGDKVQGDKIGRDRVGRDNVGRDQVIGDKIGGDGAPTAIGAVRSQLSGKASDGLISDLEQIAAMVEAGRSEEAAEAFSDLLDGVEESVEPSKLRSIWNRLVTHLPEVATVAGSLASLAALLGL